MRRDFARDMEAALLGPADLIERSSRGEVCDVETGAGEFGKLDVPRDADGFGGGRHA